MTDSTDDIVAVNLINMLLDGMTIPNEDDRIMLVVCLLTQIRRITDEVKILVTRVIERFGQDEAVTALRTRCSPWVTGIMQSLYPTIAAALRSSSPIGLDDIRLQS